MKLSEADYSRVRRRTTASPSPSKLIRREVHGRGDADSQRAHQRPHGHDVSDRHQVQESQGQARRMDDAARGRRCRRTSASAKRRTRSRCRTPPCCSRHRPDRPTHSGDRRRRGNRVGPRGQRTARSRGRSKGNHQRRLYADPRRRSQGRRALVTAEPAKNGNGGFQGCRSAANDPEAG